MIANNGIVPTGKRPGADVVSCNVFSASITSHDHPASLASIVEGGGGARGASARPPKQRGRSGSVSSVGSHISVKIVEKIKVKADEARERRKRRGKKKGLNRRQRASIARMKSKLHKKKHHRRRSKGKRTSTLGELPEGGGEGGKKKKHHRHSGKHHRHKHRKNKLASHTVRDIVDELAADPGNQGVDPSLLMEMAKRKQASSLASVRGGAGKRRTSAVASTAIDVD